MAKARKRTDSASVIDTQPPTPDTNSATADAQGTHPRDRVAMRAYELYLARGGADGGDFDDWLAAEREIGVGSGRDRSEDPGE